MSVRQRIPWERDMVAPHCRFGTRTSPGISCPWKRKPMRWPDSWNGRSRVPWVVTARHKLRLSGGIRFLLSVALVAGFSSCAGEATRDGGGDSLGAWSLAAEPDVVIGKADGETPYLFSAMGPAVLLPDGRVAVSDLDEGVIRVFRSDGSFELEMGGRGEGPGEFEYISRMVLVPPDTLVVHDSRLFRLTRYLTSGALLSTLSLKAERGRPEVFLGELPEGEMVYS